MQEIVASTYRGSSPGETRPVGCLTINGLMDGRLGELSEASDSVTVERVATGTSQGQLSLLE